MDIDFDMANLYITKFGGSRKPAAETIPEDIDINLVKEQVKSAETFILKFDRERFAKYLEAAVQFCQDKKLFIGGRYSNNVYSGKKPRETLSMYEIDIYTVNAFNMAKELSPVFYKISAECDDAFQDTIYVETSIKDLYIVIWIDARPIIKFHGLIQTRRSNMMDAIYNLEQGIAPCFPPIIQLMFIYKLLMSPYPQRGAIKYAALLEIEAAIFDRYMKSGGRKVNSIEGSIVRDYDEIKEQMEAAVLELLGENEMIVENPQYSKKKLRLQIISAGYPELIAAIETALTKKLKYEKLHYSVEILEHENYNPFDLEMTKAIVYIVDNKYRKISICDVYSCTSSTPYINGDKYKYASIYAELYYKIFDLLSLKFIMQISPQLNKTLSRMADNVLELIGELREKSVELIETSPEIIFNTNWKMFIGVSNDEMNQKRKLAKLQKQEGEFYANFYPAIDKLVNKSGGFDEIILDDR